MSVKTSGPDRTVASTPTVGGHQPPTVSRARRKFRPYLLSIPATVVLIGILYPFALGVYYTFLNYSATNSAPKFVGLANYIYVFSDPTFWNSARVTVTFAIAATVLETVLGIGIALLLNRSSIVGKIFEKVLILPLMIAPVIAAVMWKLMFNPQFGVLNYIFGLGSTFDFLNADRALWSVVLVDAWIYTPFVAILVLAGVRSLPKEPFEASAVDGASWFYMFRRLMLPMMWPYILVAVIFRFMDCLKIFDIIYVLTAGGPGDATKSMQVGAYIQSVLNFNYSMGSTYMFLLWIIIYIVANQLVKLLNKAQARAAGSEG